MSIEGSQFLVRRKDETVLYAATPSFGPVGTLFQESVSQTEFSRDGRMVCGIGTEHVAVVDNENREELLRLPQRDVLLVGWSPLSRYLITLHRPDKSLKGSDKNLQVWDIQRGEAIWGLHRSNVNTDLWPMLQWTEDEREAFVMVTNTIHGYSPLDGFTKVDKKLPVKGVSGFALSGGHQPNVATYVAESKSVPASVADYPISKFPGNQEEAPAATNRKSFFRVSGVKFFWNSPGTALLVSAFSDVDATNQSYYGEQHLHFLEGGSETSCIVPNIPSGPIHDVQWTPPGDHFAVVAGFMPAKTLLFNARCRAIFDLGSGPHNFIRFNPFGRFFCLAGFGNLPGDIVFYEKKQNGNCKKMASVRSPSVTLEWSPCGRYVLTAITAPRLRVDNGFKVMTYVGEDVDKVLEDVLLEAKWKPVPQGTFQDRPVSPSRKSTIAKASKEEETSSAYVPPHLRGRTTTAATTVSFSLGQSNDRGGRIRFEVKGKDRDVPGGTFVSKSAAKNAKRRAKKRTEGIKKQDDEEQETLNEEQESVPVASADFGTVQSEEFKRIRALKKKLKQIDQLKASVRQSGAVLEKEQLEKIETEEALLEELASLESSLEDRTGR